jgi:cell division protein FtsI/penicillin-binding protein 2
VILQPSTGYILAIANNAQFNDFALTAAVAPGSAMKIITATALINNGLTSEDSPVACPGDVHGEGASLTTTTGDNPSQRLLGSPTTSRNLATTRSRSGDAS